MPPEGLSALGSADLEGAGLTPEHASQVLRDLREVIQGLDGQHDETQVRQGARQSSTHDSHWPHRPWQPAHPLPPGVAGGVQGCAAARPPLCPPQAALRGGVRGVEGRAGAAARLGAHCRGGGRDQRRRLHARLPGRRQRTLEGPRVGVYPTTAACSPADPGTDVPPPFLRRAGSGGGPATRRPTGRCCSACRSRSRNASGPRCWSG